MVRGMICPTDEAPMTPRTNCSLTWMIVWCGALLCTVRCDGSGDTPGNTGAMGGEGGNAGSFAGLAGFSGTAGQAGTAGKESGISGVSGDSGRSGTGGGYVVSTMGCTGEEKPWGIPEDWEEWTELGCQCPMYRPGPDSTTKPAPLQWQDCTIPLPVGVQCKSLITPGNLGTDANTGFTLRRSDNAPLLLMQLRAPEIGETARHALLAEADGQILFDYLQVNAFDGCKLFPHGLNGDHYVLDLPWDTWKYPGENSFRLGAVAGSVYEAKPALILLFDSGPDAISDWAVGEDYVVRLQYSGYWTYGWDGLKKTQLWPAPDPEGLPPNRPLVVNKDVFIEVGGIYAHGVLSWTESAGFQPLIRYVGDSTRAAGLFATDGTDMVWTLGEDGPALGDKPFPTLSVMTAPYTTDPSTRIATERRLRSDLKIWDGGYWAVGCGYAARRLGTADLHHGMMVVRISDGRSWVFPGGAPGASVYSWGEPLGLSCEELYISMKPAGDQGYTIARIRLDSLGEGLPPD